MLCSLTRDTKIKVAMNRDMPHCRENDNNLLISPRLSIIHLDIQTKAIQTIPINYAFWGDLSGYKTDPGPHAAARVGTARHLERFGSTVDIIHRNLP